MEIKLDVHMDTKKLAKQFESLKNDDVMWEIHNLFAKMCDPYVPMATGTLAQSVDINIGTTSIRYPGPYAHYMYMGEVYGPNYPIKEGGEVVGYFTNPYGHKSPIIEGGIVVGWYSPPHKHPTGEPLKYNKEYHPKASKEWDKAMMLEQGDVFKNAVKDILIQRCKELYG